MGEGRHDNDLAGLVQHPKYYPRLAYTLVSLCSRWLLLYPETLKGKDNPSQVTLERLCVEIRGETVNCKYMTLRFGDERFMGRAQLLYLTQNPKFIIVG